MPVAAPASGTGVYKDLYSPDVPRWCYVDLGIYLALRVLLTEATLPAYN
jgi:hypothetical protein